MGWGGGEEEVGEEELINPFQDIWAHWSANPGTS